MKVNILNYLLNVPKILINVNLYWLKLLLVSVIRKCLKMLKCNNKYKFIFEIKYTILIKQNF